MKIKGRDFRIAQFLCIMLYYGVFRWLPESAKWGRVGKRLRYFACKRIFKKCGKNVNVERLANFGSGLDIEIGDNSGLGINCCVPSNTIIGNDVMMGPNCYILARNHSFDRTDIPMWKQGYSGKKQVIIGNDVWIGRDVLIMPGRHIADGSIVGGGCVLTKDFPVYSIIGGNPSRLIRNRKDKKQ